MPQDRMSSKVKRLDTRNVVTGLLAETHSRAVSAALALSWDWLWPGRCKIFNYPRLSLLLGDFLFLSEQRQKSESNHDRMQSNLRRMTCPTNASVGTLPMSGLQLLQLSVASQIVTQPKPDRCISKHAALSGDRIRTIRTIIMNMDSDLSVASGPKSALLSQNHDTHRAPMVEESLQILGPRRLIHPRILECIIRFARHCMHILYHLSTQRPWFLVTLPTSPDRGMQEKEKRDSSEGPRVVRYTDVITDAWTWSLTLEQHCDVMWNLPRSSDIFIHTPITNRVIRTDDVVTPAPSRNLVVCTDHVITQSSFKYCSVMC